MSAALVLFMTPGLAFFYGGMVRSKNVLGMLMQNFFSMGLVSVLWAVVGFSLAFGDGGRLDRQLRLRRAEGRRPTRRRTCRATWRPRPQSSRHSRSCAYQMMFAVITPALITGAIADRLKFAGYAVFIALWLLLVYSPVAHWVFSPTGWLFKRGALDFAGGTVVHINAGIAALAVVLVIGKRKGWPSDPMPPHSPAPHAARHRHPVVRLVRLQRRLGARRQRGGRAGAHQHAPRGGRRHARLAGRRADQGWTRHDPRRRFGRRRRTRGHHAVRRVRRRARPDSSSGSSPASSASSPSS